MSRLRANAFPLALTALFLVRGAVAAAHHELWRDEAQAWLIARDVPLSRLFAELHYEGHPALWFLLLKPLTWITWAQAASTSG